MPKIVTQPYSVDKKINFGNTYSDSDTDTNFDLFYYNYADFDKTLQRTPSDQTQYKKGVLARICREYYNQSDFKKSCLSNKKLNVRDGIVKIHGALDLTKSESGSSIYRLTNINKCIVISTGKITLPSIYKKDDESTITFIAAYKKNISDSGKFNLTHGNKFFASLITWRDDSENISISPNTKIKGTLAVNKLFLKNNLPSNSSTVLIYDPALQKDTSSGMNDYFFSFLGNYGGVW